MKTINHKGKTLHLHAPTGFYIDLAAVVEFAAALDARIEARMAQRNLKLKPPFEGEWPEPEKQRLLLRRRAHTVLESKLGESEYIYDNVEGEIWVPNVEVTFSEWGHGSDDSTKYIHGDWQKYIGKRVYWCLPFSRSPLYGFPLTGEWFPMSACYSPARIMLENSK